MARPESFGSLGEGQAEVQRLKAAPGDGFWLLQALLAGISKPCWNAGACPGVCSSPHINGSQGREKFITQREREKGIIPKGFSFPSSRPSGVAQGKQIKFVK